MHVDVVKEITEGQRDLVLALSPNRSQEEEININGETGGGNVNISVRSSNRTFELPERLSRAPFC